MLLQQIFLLGYMARFTCISYKGSNNRSLTDFGYVGSHVLGLRPMTSKLQANDANM